MKDNHPIRTLVRKWLGFPQLSDWQQMMMARRDQAENDIGELKSYVAQKKFAEYEASPEWAAIQARVQNLR